MLYIYENINHWNKNSFEINEICLILYITDCSTQERNPANN